MEEKIKYMEALHLNERERLVIHEGGYIIGKQDGLEEGRAEGLAKGLTTVAKAMKEKGLPEEMICEVTGLSRESVEAL